MSTTCICGKCDDQEARAAAAAKQRQQRQQQLRQWRLHQQQQWQQESSADPEAVTQAAAAAAKLKGARPRDTPPRTTFPDVLVWVAIDIFERQVQDALQNISSSSSSDQPSNPPQSRHARRSAAGPAAATRPARRSGGRQARAELQTGTASSGDMAGDPDQSSSSSSSDACSDASGLVRVSPSYTGGPGVDTAHLPLPGSVGQTVAERQMQLQKAMKKPALRQMCSDYGLKSRTKDSKPQLAEIIAEHEASTGLLAAPQLHAADRDESAANELQSDRHARHG